MSKIGTMILALAVLAIGLIAAYAGFNAASQAFAFHMAVIALACAIFLIFIRKRATQSSC